MKVLSILYTAPVVASLKLFGRHSTYPVHYQARILSNTLEAFSELCQPQSLLLPNIPGGLQQALLDSKCLTSLSAQDVFNKLYSLPNTRRRRPVWIPPGGLPHAIFNTDYGFLRAT